METINICLKVLRNNKKAVKRRFQLKQVPEFSSVSELKTFVVTEKSSVSFFTKIQIRIFNPKRDISFFFNKSPKRSLPNDPQRTNGGGFIGSYPKPDTLKGFPHYGSEKSEYYQRQLENILYIHQLFDETAYLSGLFWTGVMDQTIDFIRFIGVVKSQYKQDLHCSSYKKKLLYNSAGASCKTLLFQDSPSFGPSEAVS